MREEVLYAENLVTAQINGQHLDFVSFSLNKGEVFGITGLNGDGLLALSDVLTGVMKPLSGNLYLNGEKISLDSPEKSRQMGIYDIKDSLSIVPYMTIAENMNVLGPYSWKKFFIKPHKNLMLTKQIFDYYELNFDSEGQAQKLTYAQRTALSICRALLGDAKILICQEVGEGFSEIELDEFSHFIKKLSQEGISIILINSDARMSLRFSDKVAVMRNGMICYLRENQDANIDEMYNYMSPQLNSTSLNQLSDIRRSEIPLHLYKLSTAELKGQYITVELQSGKAIGIHCSFHGSDDLLYRMFSGQIAVKGTVLDCSKKISFSKWRKQNEKNIYCLKKRFWKDAIYNNMTVAENIVMQIYHRSDSHGGLLKKPMLHLALQEFAIAHQIDLECLDFYPYHLDVEMRNQIVLWRLLFAPPKLLVLDSPCFAIDEKTKQYFFRCIDELKTKGTAIFWSNNDGMMLNNYCDQIIQIKDE